MSTGWSSAERALYAHISLGHDLQVSDHQSLADEHPMSYWMAVAASLVDPDTGGREMYVSAQVVGAMWKSPQWRVVALGSLVRALWDEGGIEDRDSALEHYQERLEALGPGVEVLFRDLVHGCLVSQRGAGWRGVEALVSATEASFAGAAPTEPAGPDQS